MVRLVPLVEVRAAFLAEIAPVAMAHVATGKAGGLVLAQAAQAPAAVPAEAIALEGGYAVAARSTVGASSYMPALLPSVPQPVERGETMPAGTDAIADIEDVREIAGVAEILASVAPGRHVRRAGGDLAAGRVIVAAGTRLRAAQIAVLRASGVGEIPVRAPAIIIMTPPGSRVSAAMLMELSSRAGAEVDIAYVPQARLPEALGSAEKADLVLLAGWNGAAFEAAARALAEAGKIMAQGLAVAPGAAMGCGFAEAKGGRRTPVVLIPDRLEDGLAAWLLLARPCLDRLAGATIPRASARLPLARKIASAPGMLDLALVKREGDMWKPLAAGDISWGAIADADAWLAIAAGSEGFGAGEMVEAEYL
ncbi:MAG: molybdopterin-binding protein [Beijerinckiaceae bacterium]